MVDFSPNPCSFLLLVGFNKHKAQMQKFFLSLLLSAGMAAVAIAGNPVKDGFVKVDPTNSTIAWSAKKVTGQHHGSINIKEGSMKMKKGQLVGGSFTIDMNTIKVLDLTGGGATKLENHL